MGGRKIIFLFSKSYGMLEHFEADFFAFLISDLEFLGFFQEKNYLNLLCCYTSSSWFLKSERPLRIDKKKQTIYVCTYFVDLKRKKASHELALFSNEEWDYMHLVYDEMYVF